MGGLSEALDAEEKAFRQCVVSLRQPTGQQPVDATLTTATALRNYEYVACLCCWHDGFSLFSRITLSCVVFHDLHHLLTFPGDRDICARFPPVVPPAVEICMRSSDAISAVKSFAWLSSSSGPNSASSGGPGTDGSELS